MNTHNQLTVYSLKRIGFLFYFITIIVLSHLTQTVQCVSIPRQFESNDYYEVLGLSKRFAPTKQIKKAYHQLALKYHPDKVENQSDNNEQEKSEAIFIKISEAYDVLSDERLKDIYDKYGKMGLENHSNGINPEEAAGFGGDGNGNDHVYEFNFNGGQNYPRKQGEESSFSEHNTFSFSTGGGSFSFSAGGDNDNMEWETWNGSSFGMMAIIPMLLLSLFMFIVVLLIFSVVLGIVFFPITIFLIWRWRRKRRSN